MLDSLQGIQSEANFQLALRVYGHQKPVPPQDCSDTKLEVPFGTGNIYKIKRVLRAINPMGTSPTFSCSDGCTHVWESSCILTHLLEQYDTPGHKMHPRPGSKERIKFLQLQSFLLTTVYPSVATLFLHTLKPPEQQDPAFVSSGKDKWAHTLAPILATALGDKPYLLGDELSAVDLLLAKPLRNASSLGVLTAFPTLDAHLARIAARESYAVAYAIKQG